MDLVSGGVFSEDVFLEAPDVLFGRLGIEHAHDGSDADHEVGVGFDDLGVEPTGSPTREPDLPRDANRVKSTYPRLHLDPILELEPIGFRLHRPPQTKTPEPWP